MAGKAKNVLPFNSQSVSKAKAVGGKQTEYQIDGVKGLGLIVQPSGTSSWWFRYTTGSAGKRKYRKMKIGSRDGTTLAEARTRAISLQQRVEAKEDPVAIQGEREAAITLYELADRFIEEGSLAASTQNNYRNFVTYYVPKQLGEKAAIDVTQNDIIAICAALEGREHYAQSERTKSMLGGCFRFGIRKGIVKTSPVTGIGTRIPDRQRKTKRERTPSTDELAIVWTGMDDQERVSISNSMKTIIRLAILTGQRRTEICGMRKDELSGLDTDNPTWTIPGDSTVRGKLIRGRTKNGRAQTVYLSAEATSLIEEALEETNSNYVFPARVSVVKIGKNDGPRSPHINGEAASKAMRNIRLAYDIEGLTLHDFRRGTANWLKDEGFSKDVREPILNHKDDSVNSQHYANTAMMETQCRAAWQAWSDHVMSVALTSTRQYGRQIDPSLCQ